MAQGWVHLDDAWRIAYVQRQDAARLKQPLEQRDLYPASADAKAEIAAAIHKATGGRKRVLVRLWRELVLRLPRTRGSVPQPGNFSTMAKSF